jgi:hypothetical protein
MVRRLPNWQLGAASLGLGLLWGIALVGLLVPALAARGRSMLVFAALGSMVGLIGCLMLTLAFFPTLVRWLRLVGWLAVVGGALEAAAVVWSALDLPPAQLRWFADANASRVTSDPLMALSLFVMTASACLIVTRLLSDRVARWRFEPLGAVQALFLMFWRQHQLIGWMALALAAGHSVYYLLYPGAFDEQWTGVASIGLLGLLGVIGVFTTYRKRVALWTHRIIAVALGFMLTLHWRAFLGAEAGILIVLGITALVNLKLAAAVVRSATAMARRVSREGAPVHPGPDA